MLPKPVSPFYGISYLIDKLKQKRVEAKLDRSPYSKWLVSICKTAVICRWIMKIEKSLFHFYSLLAYVKSMM